jgi:hypothetical protein
MHPLLAKARFDADLAGVTEELCEMRGWTVFEREYPIFDVGFRLPGGATLRIRMECEGWNEQAPAIVLQDWEGCHLTSVPATSKNIFNPSAHRHTGRPFVCMRGAREYHTHENHLNDPWSALSGSADYRLGEIATQIWNGWRKANQ